MRYALALLVVLPATAVWLSSDATIEAASFWIITSYIASCVLVFPLEIRLFTATLFVSIFIGLYKINEIKLSLTQLPLTFMDLTIAYNNPDGLLAALKIPHWVIFLVYIILTGVALAGTTLVLRRLRKEFKSGFPIRRAAVGVGLFLLSAVMLYQFTGLLDGRLEAAMSEDHAVWEPKGVAALSQRIGLLPYLALSYALERADPTESFSASPGLEPLNPKELSDVIDRYVHPSPHASDRMPNIVLVQAESTFDPNKTFNLSKPVGGAVLTRQADTQSLGQLRVNPIGGGSWVTEFETITGVDSRFFGYSGFYTHSSLSPYIHNTFATYLNSRGFHTHAFYAVPGTFYNARNAYKNYGFQDFYDSIDLGHGVAWGLSDSALIDDVIGRLGPNPDAPFYAFVLTIQNHSPHPCQHFSSQDQFVTSLVGDRDFDTNCELNEYLFRLQSTNTAFEKLDAYLSELERKTGRPFVMLIYGDHQPATFTGTAGAPHDFSPYRTSVSIKETVFHLVSSLPGVVSCCDAALPAALVPSVLSAFTATDSQDVYLGINFYLYAKCGADVFPGATPAGLYGQTTKRDALNPLCKQAEEQAFSAYRRYGVY
jgi:phosphoglycerol transferase MdoB-like AlkP superfamily enzyme